MYNTYARTLVPRQYIKYYIDMIDVNEATSSWTKNNLKKKGEGDYGY